MEGGGVSAGVGWVGAWSQQEPMEEAHRKQEVKPLLPARSFHHHLLDKMYQTCWQRNTAQKAPDPLSQQKEGLRSTISITGTGGQETEWSCSWILVLVNAEIITSVCRNFGGA